MQPPFMCPLMGHIVSHAYAPSLAMEWQFSRSIFILKNPDKILDIDTYVEFLYIHYVQN